MMKLVQIPDLNLALYGQENDNATAALAKMNMILHHCPTAEIWKDNVLSSPYFKQLNGGLKTFDFVVSILLSPQKLGVMVSTLTTIHTIVLTTVSHRLKMVTMPFYSMFSLH